MVGEICFIATLVIHGSGSSSSGSSRGTHTSASIRWIRPSYMYPDESSRVVVYWMKSHNLFGCYVDEIVKIHLIACWICWLDLAYPFCCMFVMYVAVLLAMIINLVDGSRWARSSWSTREWWSSSLAIRARIRTSFFHVSLGLWPLYLLLPDL